MHTKEAKKQRTGTGRITNISLKNSEIIVGIDFTKNRRLHTLLADPDYYPMMLFPGDDALNVQSPNFIQNIGDKTLLILVIDGTWACAKSIINKNPFLLDLPKISFCGSYRSMYTFKKEPKPDYISTIESCFYLIKELQTAGVVSPDADPSPMMNAFKQLVTFQLTAENERILGLRKGVHAHDDKCTRLKDIPKF
jgi:DTW domain-containing protein YfiP